MASTTPRGTRIPKLAFDVLATTHILWYRATAGLIGHRVGRLSMLLLEHVGSKSGKHYTAPLLYGRDGDNLLLVASKGGAPRHPAWYGNLMAHPDVEVQVGRQRKRVRARTATAAERPRLWKIMTGQWPGYDGYQRSTDRVIPVVVLEPR
jgi:deazaflavin-dependent oxidoreductase (nitroreductase family)